MTIPIYDYRERADAIANAYWQERWKPGGTTVTTAYHPFVVAPDGEITAKKAGDRVGQSRACDKLWRELTALTEESSERNRTRLVEMGMPEELARLAGPENPRPTEGGGGILVSLHWPDEDLLYTIMERKGFRMALEEAWTGHRMIFTDGDRALVTWVEGDLSIEWFFSSDSLGPAMDRAAQYYKRAA